MLRCSAQAKRAAQSPPHRSFTVSLASPSTHIHFLMVFCTAANTLQVRGLANIVNAALLVFVVSAANSDLYIASRTLYSLALLGHAPRIFRKVTRRGVPIWALLTCWIFTMLVFLNVAEGSHNGMSPWLFRPILVLNHCLHSILSSRWSSRHVRGNHLE